MDEERVRPGGPTHSVGDRGDRPSHTRDIVSRRVEVWLHEDVFALGSVVDASPHRIRVQVSDRARALLTDGQQCVLKIHGESGVWVCTAQIEHRDRQAVDFKVLTLVTPS